MLIATHEMGFARDVANRVCFLDAGAILEEGPPEQIFGAPREERTQQFLAADRKNRSPARQRSRLGVPGFSRASGCLAGRSSKRDVERDEHDDALVEALT